MKRKTLGVASIAMYSLALYFCSCNPSATVGGMRSEYRADPIGIDASAPRFTWNDLKESSSMKYRVKLAESARNLSDDAKCVWISRNVNPGESMVRYDGTKPLQAHAKYFWAVEASGNGGSYKQVSPIATFETGKMKAADWTASWISDNHARQYAPAPMFRKTFEVPVKLVAQARLYISAAAYYKVWVNGHTVNAVGLNPGYTHYDKRNLYNTYDVTSLLTKDKNAISAVLGNGFYNEVDAVATWSFDKARWSNRPRMICELHITYSDGTNQVVVSDDTWKTSTGARVQNNIYSGDTYDARLETSDWKLAAFDDSAWSNAMKVASPSSKLVSQNMPLVDVDQHIKPVGMKNWGDTVYVFDFGKNMSGVCTLSAAGHPGTKIQMQHGELLKSDGRLEMRNLDIYYKPLPGLAFQNDVIVLGDKPCTFTPEFTYHGFRYVEVRCSEPVKLTEQSITANFFHTKLNPVGTFSCSNEWLNKLWSASRQSYLCNMMSIPTDCPQREKNGWTADAHITLDLGLLNFDGITLYEKWLDDMIDNQTAAGRISGIIPSSGWGYDDWIGPVWDAAMFIVPMTLYNYYGDTQSIAKMWDTCVRYLDYLASREDADHTVTYGIGDWVFYKTQTPTEYTTTCYYYLDNLYMSRFAQVLGMNGDKYMRKANYLKTLINEKYFDANRKLYANGSQAAQGVALYLGLVPEEYQQAVADNLAAMIEQNHGQLDFGMLGSKTVLRMLCKYGHEDLAFRMATSTKEPSWAAWMKKGFTTLPETWTLSPEFRDASTNHMFLGDINAWMYQVLAGINYDELQPGFKHILLEPHFPAGLDWVKAQYQSVKGAIVVDWKRQGRNIEYQVTIPAGTTATLLYGGKQQHMEARHHILTLNASPQ